MNKKNNIVIFASTPYSHIIPIAPLVEYLISREYRVHCFSSMNNKQLIESMGMEFHCYIDGIYIERDHNYFNSKYLNNFAQLLNEGKYLDAFNHYIKYDILEMYNINLSHIENYFIEIKKINPLIIFRDSADKIGYYLSEYYGIDSIGYITNNLYSKLYFDQNPLKFYSYLMNIFPNSNSDFNCYISNFYEYLNEANSNTAKQLNIKPLLVQHQLDPRSQTTIIFSTDFFQPTKALYHDREYIFIYPKVERFIIEPNVSKNISNFLNTNLPVIYIATGSLISNSLDYYIRYINGFINQNIKVVIACKNHFTQLSDYVHKHDLLKNILILDYAPQKYILSKVKLFITSGGQNSILESIYYEVPMLIDPITSEQRLNAYEVQRLNIGLTNSPVISGTKSLGRLINILLTSSEIKQNLAQYSKKLKENRNYFGVLDNIFENLNLNKNGGHTK